jgi:large subunit ribosomal protein L18
LASKNDMRQGRHFRIRKTLKGTATKPRLCVFRSAKHVYAQLIDDAAGTTLVAASSTGKDFAGYDSHRGNAKAAEKLGEIIGKKALEKGIKQVVFDRGGYMYHGRVKALADAARKAGLEF